MSTRKTFLLKTLPVLVSGALFATVMHASAADKVLGSNLYDIVVGDFDGDQMSDVIRQGARRELEHSAILAAVQQADVQRWQDGFLDTVWNRDAAQLIVGDFNGDASADLLIQRNNPVSVATVVHAYADGRLGVPVQAVGEWYLGLQWDAAHRRLLAADFNGDGRDDLFLQGHTDADRHALALASADGTFTELVSSFDNAHLNRSWSVANTTLATGDFDGNGRYELLLQPATGDADTLVVGADQTGALNHQQTVIPAQHLNLDWSSNRHRAVVGDFNGDGKDDVFLLAAHVVEQSAYVPSTGTSFERIDRVIDRIADLDQLKQVLVGDFDADGIDDLILLYQDPSLAPTVLLADAARAARLAGFLRKLGLLQANQTLRHHEGQKTQASTSAQLNTTSANAMTPKSKGAMSTASVASKQSDVLPAPSWNEFGPSGGQFRVDESGSATYTLPIEAAPGSGGFAPKVSLNYNSGAGNGPLGIGWSIGGLSVLRWCDGWLCLDGARLNFLRTGTDEIATTINGIAASLVSCPEGYTVSGRWRTEIDQGVVIAECGKNGDASLAARRYVAVRKDGTKSIYAGFGAPVWPVIQQEDAAGNYVQFDYIGDAANPLIQTIRYTGNLRTGQAPYASLSFNYDTNRLDRSEGYFGGQFARQLHRLISIDSISEGQVLRKYILTYAAPEVSVLSRLKYVQECRLDSCLPPIAFDWSGLDMGFTAQPEPLQDFTNRYYSGMPADTNGDGKSDLIWVYQDGSENKYLRTYVSDGKKLSVPASQEWIRFRSLGRHSLKVIDFNGDGRSDALHAMCFPSTDHCNEQRWVVRLGMQEGALSTEFIDTGLVATYSSTSYLADFNGDGLPDLYYMAKVTPEQAYRDRYNRDVPSYFESPLPGAKVLVMYMSTLAKPSGSHQCAGVQTLPRCFSKPKYVQIEMGADDPFKSEFHFFSDQVSPMRYEYVDGIVISDTKVLNMNLDRNADVVYEFIGGNAGNKKYRRLYSPSWYWDYEYSGWNGSEGGQMLRPVLREMTYARDILANVDLTDGASYFTDLNGDGYTDIIYRLASGYWAYRFNTGSSFTAERALGAVTNGTYMQQLDINHDGLLDLLVPKSGKYHVRYQTVDAQGNTSFTPEQATTAVFGYPSDGQSTMFMDMDGDGTSDRLVLDTRSTDWHQVQHFAGYGEARNVITGITSGTGAKTQVTYKPLSDRSVYTPPSYAAGEHSGLLAWGAPVIDIPTGSFVVSAVNSSAPNAGASPRAIDQSATVRVDYRYAGLRLQGGGRGMLGFEKLVTVDAQTGVETTTQYAQQFPYTGLPIKTEKRSSTGRLISQIKNCSGESLLPTDCFTLQSSSLGAPMPTVTTSLEQNWDLSGDLTSITVTKSAYDSYGNATRLEVTQYDNVGAVAQTKVTESDFGSDVKGLFFGRLKSATVTTSRPDMAANVRTSAFTYASDTSLLETEIIEPNGTDTEYLKTRYVRDSFGNKRVTIVCSKPVLDCNEAGSENSENPNYIHRVSSVVYDSKGRFVDRAINHYGQTVEWVLERNALYQPKRFMAASGRIGTKEYSTIGRLMSQTDGAGGSVTFAIEKCGTCIAGAAYVERTTPNNAPASGKYYDLIGRELAVETVAFDGRAIRVYSEYDALSRLKRQSLPVFSDAAPLAWTENQHDAFGRVTRSVQPNGAVTDFTYAGLVSSQTTTVARSATTVSTQTKVEQRNTLGELLSVRDNNSQLVKYSYRVEGQLATLSRAGTNALQSELRYDRLGRKIYMWDADKSPAATVGAEGWFYEYNPVGAIVKQTDARGFVTSNQYDAMGRLIRRIEKNASGEVLANTQWTYDNSANMSATAGQLLRERDEISKHSRTYGYDSLGRLKSTTHVLDGSTFNESVEYNAIGQLQIKRDATGRGVRHLYNSYHYLREIQEADVSSIVFQRINSMDEWGHVTQETMGNGAIINRSYYPLTGLLKAIVTTHNGNTKQNLSYTWDDFGNLHTRTDTSANKSLNEVFAYDQLNRLKTAQTGTPGSGPLLSLDYNDEGNILRKSDVTGGDYQYGGKHATCNGAGQVVAGPHAVTQAGGNSYCYDKNGNMVAGAGRTLVYDTSFDLPTEVRSNQHTTLYRYGLDHGRYKRTDQRAGEADTVTYYIGAVEVIAKADGKTEFRRHVPNGVIANGKQSFILTDHLGSTDLILDCFGAITQSFSFDAFGKPREPNSWVLRSGNWQAPWSGTMQMQSPRSGAKTLHGYTGHEMMDELGLINMNGRFYDAHLGRFLQADPFIEAPKHSQSLNRYSYLWNNPLNGTDPSGFWSRRTQNALRQVASIVVTAVACMTGAACASVSAAVAAANAKYAGASDRGVLKAAVLSYATAAAFNAAGSSVGGGQNADRWIQIGARRWATVGEYAQLVGMHAVIGGVSAHLQGGEFGHGFVSAGLTKGFSPVIGNMAHNSIAQLTATTILGGTISELAGDKFGNGAATAAFQYLFNWASSEVKKRNFNMFDPKKEDDKRQYESFERLPEEEGVIKIGGHGYPGGVEGFRSLRDFAEHIKKLPGYSEDALIEVLYCHSASETDLQWGEPVVSVIKGLQMYLPNPLKGTNAWIDWSDNKMIIAEEVPNNAPPGQPRPAPFIGNARWITLEGRK